MPLLHDEREQRLESHGAQHLLSSAAPVIRHKLGTARPCQLDRLGGRDPLKDVGVQVAVVRGQENPVSLGESVPSLNRQPKLKK